MILLNMIIKSHLLFDQVDPREADEDVAQAGGVRVLRLMKVRGELEVGVHVPRGWGKTEDERKEEVAPVKTLLCFSQPGFHPDRRSDFRSINLCARNFNCSHICLLRVSPLNFSHFDICTVPDVDGSERESYHFIIPICKEESIVSLLSAYCQLIVSKNLTTFTCLLNIARIANAVQVTQ